MTWQCDYDSTSALDAARKAWADEVSGALGFGSATDMKLALGLDITDPNLGPANFTSAIQTVVLPFLERKQQSILKEAGSAISSMPGAATTGAISVPANVSGALKASAPGKYTLSDGSVWIKAADGTISKGGG